MKPSTAIVRGWRDRGGALVFLLVFSVLLIGFASAFLSRGLRENRAGAGYRAMEQSRLAAEGLLARAEVLIRTGEVDAQGRNVLVETTLATGPIRFLADGSPAVNEISGEDYRLLLSAAEGSVWISRLTSRRLRLEAEATVGTETSYVSETLLTSVPVTWVQRYVTGTGLHPASLLLGQGVDPFGGGDVLVVDPPPLLLSDMDGGDLRKRIPALPPPDIVAAGQAAGPGLYESPMPGASMWSDLRARTTVEYAFFDKDGYIVELLGSSIRITEYDKDPKHGAKAPLTLPLPDDGVVYFGTDVLSLRGTVAGRVTIACQGTVHVTGSLQYVDADGDLAMLGGLSGGPEFDPNPAYDGESALGVVAHGNIFFSPAMATLTELDAAFISQTGTVGLEMFWYDPDVGLNDSGCGVPIYYDSFAARGKQGLKELGLKISAGLPCSRVAGTDLGFAQTLSLYDPNLRLMPPPGFPDLPVSLRAVTRRVGGVEGLDGTSNRFVTRRDEAALPRATDPARFEAVRELVKERYPQFGIVTGH